MSINFASSSYASAFQGLPPADPETFRKQTLEYLKSFDEQKWYSEPIVTILKGEKLGLAKEEWKETVDAFGKVNGMQQFATSEQVAQLDHHIASFQSPYKDLREPMRRIEAKLFDQHAGFLIGNQALDFSKQDGITEMEEGVMANHVERTLNDMLLKDETEGRVNISRKLIYVSCVSNFTNFLDLFRKTVRSLELGIPCAVLSRSNTAQHSFRWTELLIQLMKEEGIDDLGMLTFLSCTLDDIKMLTKKHQAVTGNLYATCSRALAEQMISGYPNTVASTGGPNTLVTTEWTDAVKDAIRMSATIESSGQCTALRHAVVPPSLDSDELKSVFTATQAVPEVAYALEQELFDGVFANHKGTPEPPKESYDRIESADAFVKINTDSLPGDDLDEYWRKVAVDFSRLETGDSDKLDSLAVWLNKHQPITLAVNSPHDKMLALGKSLFEKTGLVVYTLGSTDNPDVPPGLTCQARPQEAEVFGEFPPRSTLSKYTRFPVVVPSSTPSYDSRYTSAYLEGKATNMTDTPAPLKPLVDSVEDLATRGYCIELLEYLKDVCTTNPKRGFGKSRTVLWGLQRPPILGNKTVIRCGPNTVPEAILPLLVLFLATNAKDQVFVSIHPENPKLASLLGNDTLISLQTDEEYAQYKPSADAYNVVEEPESMKTFPMVGNFVSLYMPLGHIKSTKPDDEEFVAALSKSDKWLRFIE